MHTNHGESDRAFQVVINDPSDDELHILLVDFETGQVSEYESPDPLATTDNDHSVPVTPVAPETDRVTLKELPAQGFRYLY